MYSLDIQVENIKCAGCINTITKNLLKIKNVDNVLVDLVQQVVHLSGERPIPQEEVVTELAVMGYPKVGHNHLGHKAKSFVSCAIGRLTN